MQITSWANKRVLITGSSGFVGSHLVAYFLRNNASVLGLSRHPKITCVEKQVDITSKNEVVQTVRAFKPHVCFHLASEALVESGADDPYRTFEINVVGTLNMLEACRLEQVKRIVIASSSHVYGKSRTPHTEDEPARPSRPYETSKTCIDLIAQSYADSFNLPVLIPRFVNIYGPGDLNFSRVVPKTMKAIVVGDSPTLWGGAARRQYLYIDDAVSAYSTISKISDTELTRNRIYNIGSNDALSVRELMGKIIALSSFSSHITNVASKRKEELKEQIVSWQKAKHSLGWSPKVDLDTGLKRTYAWYKNYFLSVKKGVSR